MVRITFIRHDGVEHPVTASPGMSLMEAAVKNNVPGIDADCGGACACATCHVFIDTAWFDRLGDRSPTEDSMLEFAENVGATSRLACQVAVSTALDGLVARIPESQH